MFLIQRKRNHFYSNKVRFRFLFLPFSDRIIVVNTPKGEWTPQFPTTTDLGAAIAFVSFWFNFLGYLEASAYPTLVLNNSCLFDSRETKMLFLLLVVFCLLVCFASFDSKLDLKTERKKNLPQLIVTHLYQNAREEQMRIQLSSIFKLSS